MSSQTILNLIKLNGTYLEKNYALYYNEKVFLLSLYNKTGRKVTFYYQKLKIL